MTPKQENWEIGQTFDDFLKEEGLYELIKFKALASYLIELSVVQPEFSRIISQSINEFVSEILAKTTLEYKNY